MESVDYQKVNSIKVGKFLLSKGFALSSCNGVALGLLEAQSALGILCEAKPRKYLFGLIVRKPRRELLGMVTFDLGGKWSFDIYGRKNVELCRQLADEMTSAFKAKITVRLLSEEPHLESYTADWDM